MMPNPGAHRAPLQQAPEDGRTPRRFALSEATQIRVSVLDCGGPPPLFHQSAPCCPPSSDSGPRARRLTAESQTAALSPIRGGCNRSLCPPSFLPLKSTLARRSPAFVKNQDRERANPIPRRVQTFNSIKLQGRLNRERVAQLLLLILHE